MTARIAILIPAYNAEPMIGHVLDSVTPFEIPILVINDGSTDRTGEILAAYSPRFLETHAENRGKGAALKTGFARAAAEGFTHALTLDADGQHPVESIPDFVKRCNEKPGAILVGNRFGDETIRSMPRVRRFSNGISSRLISLAAGSPIPDAQCGMRVYPLSVLPPLNLVSDGYALESEVLVKAGLHGVEVENIPIACHYPMGTTTSGYRAFADSWRIAKIVLRSLREGRKNR